MLKEVLIPNRPDDAIAYIALTTSDLWPGAGWNFVYGQATLFERVGVWSIYHNGNPVESADAFRLCLRRTIMTAIHETAHIFSIPHCIAYDCVMNGPNHRAESDSRPLLLCPVCLRKLCWNTDADPAARFTALLAFCTSQSLHNDAELITNSLRIFRENRKDLKVHLTLAVVY